MTDREKLKAAIQKNVEAEKTSLAQWLGPSPCHEKMLAMMDAIFEDYIAAHGEAGALDMLTMDFEAHVRKLRGPLQ